MKKIHDLISEFKPKTNTNCFLDNKIKQNEASIKRKHHPWKDWNIKYENIKDGQNVKANFVMVSSNISSGKTAKSTWCYNKNV